MISETRSRARMKLEGASHSAAVSRATSYFSPAAAYSDLTGGIEYYSFLEQLEKNYPAKKAETAQRLKQVAEKLFTKENMLVSYTADKEAMNSFCRVLRN